jgi:thiamine pyrophosphate-dependent acetolactate synthase large subunit-like protein
LKIYEAVAHALAEEGVDEIFGLMGDGNLRLLTYWSQELGRGYFGARHESAAVAMADGYARVSGRVGVCSTTQGPGVTNTLTALINARKARTPIVLLVGDVAAFQKGWPQDIDHGAVFAAADVPLITIDDPATAYSDVLRAMRLAQQRRGPVGVNLPIDAQEREWNAWEDETALETETSAAPSVDVGEIRRAAEVLAQGQRIVVLAGRGAVEADCADSLMLIADRLDALLVTSLGGKGLFGEHPFSLGVAGGLGSNQAVQLIGAADTVLVVGAGMNDFTTMRGTLLSEKTRIVRCDLDAPRAHALPNTSVALVGDAADVLAALDIELARRGTAKVGYRTAAADQLRERARDSEFQRVDDPDAADPREVVIRLDEMLPRDRTVITDAGHFFGYPVAYMGVPDGRSFVCGIDFGSIGLGIGLAMGAAVARRDRPTVLFVGDGGMLMSLGDLETVVRYHLPICIVVLNDAAYGSELQILRLWELPEQLSVFPTTDFAAAATALGMPASTARSVEDVERFAKDIAWGEGPTLVDCVISRSVRAAWLEEAFRH